MGSFLDLDSSSSLGCLVPPQACALQTNYISLLKRGTKNIEIQWIFNSARTHWMIETCGNKPSNITGIWNPTIEQSRT